MKDTQMITGSEVYRVALLIYNLADAARKMPMEDAQSAHELLKARFTQTTNTPKLTEEKPSTTLVFLVDRVKSERYRSKNEYEQFLKVVLITIIERSDSNNVYPPLIVVGKSIGIEHLVTKLLGTSIHLVLYLTNLRESLTITVPQITYTGGEGYLSSKVNTSSRASKISNKKKQNEFDY